MVQGRVGEALTVRVAVVAADAEVDSADLEVALREEWAANRPSIGII